jgi:hypothetical protein
MPDTLAAPAAATPTNEELQAQANAFENEFFDNTSLDRHKPNLDSDIYLRETKDLENPTPPTDRKAEDKKKEETTPATPAAPAATPAAPATTTAPADATLDGLLPDGAPAPAATPAATPATPAATPAPAATAQPAQPFIDPDDVADRVVSRMRQTTATPPADTYAGLSEDDREELRDIEHLETINPAYKGASGKAREFYTRAAAYRAKWLQENPGEVFNPSADVHNEFYSKFNINIPDRVLNDARIDRVATEKASKLVDQEVNKRLAPIEEKAREAERAAAEVKAKPAIDQSVGVAIVDMVIQAVPEFKDAMPDGVLSSQAIKTMQEKNPQALALINREARVLREVVREINSAEHLGQNYAPDTDRVVKLSDGRTIRPVAIVSQVIDELEVDLLRKPQSETLRDGRRLISLAKMQELEKKFPDRHQEIYAAFWVVGLDDARKEIVRRSAENVKDLLGVVGKGAPAATTSYAPAAKTTTPAVPAQPAVPAARTAPPATTSASDNVDTKIPGAPGATSNADAFERGMFG